MPEDTLAASDVSPVLLLILDGWGIGKKDEGNAVFQARTPVLDSLTANNPTAELTCSGRAVGLPEGFMGNSEVGHMNIGAGRVVYQDMTRIDIAVEEGALAARPAISGLLTSLKKSGGRLHLLGLLSDGGVHSHIRHLYALVEAAREAGVPACIHAFMDGRDTPPQSGLQFIKELEAELQCIGHGTIASVTGRYYAMDRDQRWDRNEIAWNALVHGIAEYSASAVEAVESAYSAGETDEFIKPRVIAVAEQPKKLIADNDGVFFFNFRADRARQLTRCFTDKAFTAFDRKAVPRLCGFATMTSYDSSFKQPVAFSKEALTDTLGEVAAKAGLRQLRIAETEKYAHVTYFFNCGKEEPYEGEDRVLIPSPRDVATYDLKPEMSVYEVTDALLSAFDKDYSLYVCNLANLDMVGHTGIMPAAIKACEAVDACTGKIVDAFLKKGGTIILTADHGNAEQLVDDAGNPYTAHSTNPVPMVLIGAEQGVSLRSEGKLGDIAPTILDILKMAKPQAMSGESLIVKG
ncbi:2,3-bisphosphoglycerate-independent phosphoglycerate mutase [Oleidesulfovibrio sp.]|uniref:2,3-bisphosphoglycerate-independent phosphoglycerate mutase n=1 Tax=Oleidesulfovibrio sp. TaxID=2909707 RepID=UPI003A8638E6